MQLAALKRWHWVVIAIAVGLIVPAIRQAFDSDLSGDYVSGYGFLLTDQERFETALAEQYQGRRLFKDITVYPHWIDDGHPGKKLVHVVAGKYWSGREEMIDGKPQALWRPTCFLAQVPYRPMTDLGQFNRAGGPDFAKQFAAAGTKPTVLDFLNTMHAACGVTYSYAWWDAHPMATWLGGSLLVIGIIWPTLVNLLAFGTLTRPPEAKALSLWGVKAPPKPQPQATVRPYARTGLDDELEAAMRGETPTQEDPTAASPARPLSAGPLEPAVTLANGDSKEFGADKDDFYPTERHGPAHRPQP
jgi:hypothetical protein